MKSNPLASDIVKEINELLESMVDEYVELLLNFKTSSSKREELEKLVSAKRRAILLCNKITEIFNKLLRLKYL
ncbi:hypothetical protein EHP00_597 [Ecytonucleospora hepatopenaei]|uniref:Uncharacterized protein n=1 Tax=Ecytonucleospora hepatopenaei TaxID=646526 RepID=A0A1W0E7L4_9MICR|nr:hypothetical protein EHP00_597 [Ecytonucleospora hepatopenaei]